MVLNIDSTGLSNTGLVKNIRNLKVTDLDPLGKGSVFPREIEVQSIDSDGSKVVAVWDGFPNLLVDDFVVCQRDGIDSVMYVVGNSGATSNDGYLENIIEDVTPQLGADLDTNAFSIQFDDNTGIHDHTDNEQLIFQRTASAINHFGMTNAAIGNGPSLAVEGTDTNTDFFIDAKGTGNLILQNTATGNIGAGIAAPASNISSARALELNDSGATTGWDLMLSNPTMGTDEYAGRISGNHGDTALSTIGFKTDGATDSGVIQFQTNDEGAGVATVMVINRNGRVGIGIEAPAALMHLHLGDGGTLPSINTARTAFILEAAGETNFILFTPATNKGEILFADPGGQEYGALSYDHNTDYMLFRTNNTGNRMIIDDGGNVGIGSTANPSAGDGKVLFFGDNAADPTMGSNTAGFYGKDVAGTVEAFAVDEAGNAAQLTPHNFTLFTPDPTYEYPWSYFAENKYIGKRINVDVFGAFRALEALTGKQFIYLEDLPRKEILNWNDRQELEVQRSAKRREDQLQRGDPVEDLHIAKPLPGWMANIV